MKNFKKISLIVSLSLGLVIPIITFAASPITVNLGTARNFVVLSKEGSTNTLVSPLTNQNSNTLLVALNDMQNAYIKTERRTNPSETNLGAGNIGGMSFVPGIYKWNTAVTIPTDVTLSGGADDVWIFQVAGNLDESAGKNIVLTAGAQDENIFWQVAGKTTIGSAAVFNGNILGNSDIVLETGAKLSGRALSQTAVVLGENATVKLGQSGILEPTPPPVTVIPEPVVVPPVAPPVVPPVVPPVIPPEAASINVVSVVVNDHGGVKTATDFPLFVNGTPVISDVVNVFPPDVTYTITEGVDLNYTHTFSDACDTNGVLSLLPGEHKVCVVTNTDIAPIVVEPPVIPPVEPPVVPPVPPADATAPVISLVGDAIMNLNVGDTYTEPGATAIDDVDSSVAVVESGTVDTAIAGAYTVTYNAKDAAGNNAVEVTRTVNVSVPAPSLPDTGIFSQNKIDPLNILIIAGILILVGVLFSVLSKKKV